MLRSNHYERRGGENIDERILRLKKSGEWTAPLLSFGSLIPLMKALDTYGQAPMPVTVGCIGIGSVLFAAGVKLQYERDKKIETQCSENSWQEIEVGEDMQAGYKEHDAITRQIASGGQE